MADVSNTRFFTGTDAMSNLPPFCTTGFHTSVSMCGGGM